MIKKFDRGRKIAILAIAIMVLGFVSLPAASAAFTPDPNSPIGRGEHPRLHITKETLPILRKRAATTHKGEYKYLLNLANSRFGNAKASYEDVFLVFDRVNSTNPNYAKKWLLHMPFKPNINGNSSLDPIYPWHTVYDGDLVEFKSTTFETELSSEHRIKIAPGR